MGDTARARIESSSESSSGDPSPKSGNNNGSLPVLPVPGFVAPPGNNDPGDDAPLAVGPKTGEKPRRVNHKCHRHDRLKIRARQKTGQTVKNPMHIRANAHGIDDEHVRGSENPVLRGAGNLALERTTGEVYMGGFRPGEITRTTRSSTTPRNNGDNRADIPPIPASPSPRSLLTAGRRVQVGNLVTEVERDVSPRTEFASIRIEDIRLSERLLAINGISTIGELRCAPKRNRDYLIDDIRKNGYSYLNIRFLLRICDTFPPAPKNAPGNQRIEIEEVCIRRVLLDYAPKLSGLSALRMPEQAMVNAFSDETDRDAGVTPPFIPYPRPDLTKKPRIPTTRDKNGQFHRDKQRCGDYEAAIRLICSVLYIIGPAAFLPALFPGLMKKLGGLPGN